MKYLYLKILFIATIFFFFAPAVFAQDATLSFATYVEIKGKSSVPAGAIVAFTSEGYTLSKTPYDPLIVGIVVENPAVAIEIDEAEKTYPIIKSGTAPVRVSASNGPIKKGDMITSSEIAGVGMKAGKSGYVVGVALSSFSSKEPGIIPVVVSIHYQNSNPNISSNLLDVLNLSTIATFEQPLNVLKYVTAAIIVIISCLFAFFAFGRLANTGLEALGRNPLAGRTIQFGILLNVLITISIVSLGLAIAYFVIRF